MLDFKRDISQKEEENLLTLLWILKTRAMILTEEYEYKVKTSHLNDTILFKSSMSENKKIVIRRRFNNVRLDVNVKEGGFYSVEYNLETMNYQESQIFTPNVFNEYQETKNFIAKQLGQKEVEPLIDKYILDFLTSEEKERLGNKDLKVSEKELLNDLIVYYQNKYNLKEVKKNHYVFDNIKEKKEIFLLEINTTNKYITFERRENPKGDWSRKLARINYTGICYFNTGQIFYDEGYEYFKEMFELIPKLRANIYKKKLNLLKNVEKM